MKHLKWIVLGLVFALGTGVFYWKWKNDPEFRKKIRDWLQKTKDCSNETLKLFRKHVKETIEDIEKEDK